MNNKKGQVVVIMLIIAMIIGIVIPGLVFLTQHEAKWTVKEVKSTRAFHLAEAGVDRAKFKLNEGASVVTTVLQGGKIDGYKGDSASTYSDVEGGQYRIDISSSSTAGEVVITATGKDTSSNEYRTIEIRLRRQSIGGAITAPLVNLGGSPKVFWGPVMSTTNQDWDGSANQLFPRKMARGAITGDGSYGNRDNDGVASTDGLEWWSYNHPDNPVPNPPDVNTIWYLEHADVIWEDTGNGKETINNLQNNTPKIYYSKVRESIKFSGTTHFRGWLIADGDIEFNGSGDSTEGYGKYISSPPATAWKEYQKNTPKSGDGVAGAGAGGGYGADDDGNYYNEDKAEADDASRHQYPGDAGNHTATRVGDGICNGYKFGNGCVTHSNDGGAPTEPIMFKGFIYSKKNIQSTGSTAIHGAMQAGLGTAWGGGSFVIFYDDTLEIETTSSDLQQISWKELPPQTGW